MHDLFTLFVLLLAPVTPLQTGADEDSLRAEVARAFVEFLPLDFSDKDRDDYDPAELARLEALVTNLVELVEQLPAEDQELLGEDTYLDYLEQLFERFEPDSLPLVAQYRQRQLEAATRELLDEIQYALEVYLVDHGEFPPLEAGLAALRAEGHVHEDVSLDGWGQGLSYRPASGNEYSVRSIGADGVRGTEDDWLLTRGGGVTRGGAGAPTSEDAERTATASKHLTVLGRVELLAGEELRSFAPAQGEVDDVLVLEGPERTRFVRGGRELGSISNDDELRALSSLDAFAYTTDLDGETLLVSGDRRVLLESGWVSDARYLTGTDTLLYTEDDVVRCLGAEGRVAGEPAYDAWGTLHAFRERRDDGDYVHLERGVLGPFEWASAPMLVNPYSKEPVLAYRLWDGERTRVVIGDHEWHCTWAGEPIASRDGQHFAVLANFGGTPGARFETDRDHVRDPRFEALWGEPETRAHELFEGGSFSAVLDGARGPEYLSVHDLTFQDNETFAGVVYRARTEGDWRVIYQDDEVVGSTASGREVGKPLVDGAGLESAYDFEDHEGQRWIKTANGQTEVGPILGRYPGPERTFAYVTEHAALRRGQQIHWFRPGEPEPWSSAPVQQHELLDWAGTPPRPIFKVFSEGRHGLVYGQGTNVVFDEMLRPALPEVDSGLQLAAQLTWADGQTLLTVHHLDRELIRASDFDGRVTGAEFPSLLPDGRVVFVAHLDTEPLPYPQYGRGEGGQSCVVVYDNELWSFLPAADRIHGVGFSEGGRVGYVATHGDHQCVEVFEDGVVNRGEFFDSIASYTVEFAGEEPMYEVAAPERRMVVGDRKSPAASGHYQIRTLANGQRPLYGVSIDDEAFVKIGDQSVGPYGSIRIGREYADLELLVFTADNDEWTETQLVVVSTRPDELEGPPLFAETYAEFELDYTHQSDSSLVYFGSRDGEILHASLDLAGLRAAADG